MPAKVKPTPAMAPSTFSLVVMVISSGGAGAPNESRLSCGALKKDSFPNLRAPPASSAC